MQTKRKNKFISPHARKLWVTERRLIRTIMRRLNANWKSRDGPCCKNSPKNLLVYIAINPIMKTYISIYMKPDSDIKNGGLLSFC